MEDLTKKQLGFANDYLDTGNATQAVLNNYDVKSKDPLNVAGAIGSENLTKPKVIAYLESKAEEVASNMYRLALYAESEQVQVSAGKDVLDRAGFKPIERSDIQSGGKPIPIFGNIQNENKDNGEVL